MKQRLRSITGMLLSLIMGITMLLGGLGTTEKASAAATTYYVDSVEGDDGNDGTSTGTPWKTIAKVNATAFQPGDQILFKSGSIFTGTLKPISSGAEGSPIVFDKYGTGAAPILDGAGAEKVIHLINVEDITVRNLELVNDGEAKALRSGVVVEGQGAGRLHGIRLEYLNIHDIKGYSDRANRVKNAAILVRAIDGGTGELSSFDDLKIENNHIHDITTSGMYFNGTSIHGSEGASGNYSHWYTDVAIRNNIISKTGGDGIVIAYGVNPIVEHNTVYDAGINDEAKEYLSGMWSWATLSPTWQYNEVARTHSSSTQYLNDSVAFDTDIAVYGTHIYQYNYSHDNSGGFFMSMGQLKGENIVRYNISQNDGHNHNANNTISAYDVTHFYNNVFYNDTQDGMNLNNGALVTYTNNIFHLAADNGLPTKPVFDYNDYFGLAPAAGDVHALNVDPQFVDPGQGTDGLNTVEGYQLKSTSPLIGAGRAIDNNGGMDYWGNALYNGAPDIGAFEYQGTVPAAEAVAPAAPANLRLLEKTDTELGIAWDEAADDVTVKPGYEVYNAATNQLVAWTAYPTTARITRLQAETTYGFYVRTRDAAGNLSAPSETLSVTTSEPGLIVDNLEAAVVGSWSSSSWAAGKTGPTYLVSPAGSGANTVTWTPDLPKTGDYYVYYSLPDGGPTRAPDAPFTVYYDGGSHTYLVNEKPGIGGQWILLGRHHFKAGKSGSVKLTNKASGEIVIADAVKFNYIESDMPDVPMVSVGGTAQVRAGQEFQLDYHVGNVSDDVYANVLGHHLVVRYNPNLVEFVSAESALDGVALLADKTSVAGEVQLIAISEGPSNAITEAGNVLKLNWKAKNVTQNETAAFSILWAELGNGAGEMMEAVVQPAHNVAIVLVDATALQAKIVEAQGAHDAAVEGLEKDLYRIGTKAVLQAAIDAAEAAVGNAATQQTIDGAVVALEAALQTFLASIYTYVPGDVAGGPNGTPNDTLDIGDLSYIAAHYYDMTSAAPEWNKAKRADMDDNNKIDLVDLVKIALKILK